MRLPQSRSPGFTLPELVMTIVVIAVLGALVAPRFMAAGAFESRGFYDEVQSVVRFAQKIAIARRRTITVCVEADRVFAIAAGTCAAPTHLVHPVTGGNLTTRVAPSVVTLAVAGSFFTFDGLGRPSAATTITVTSTVPGDPPRQIMVAAETGYVSR
jgi:MSHA pilin protein MshC